MNSVIAILQNIIVEIRANISHNVAMIRFFKIILAVLFIFMGLAAAIWGGYQVSQANWVALLLVLSGVGLIIAGWMLLVGYSIKQVLESLDGIFMR